MKKTSISYGRYFKLTRASQSVAALAFCLALLGGAPLARATSLTWSVGGTTTPTEGSGTWDTTHLNWTTGSASSDWVSGDSAIIGAGGTLAGSLTKINFDAASTVGNITFNAVSGGGSYMVSGANTMTFNGGTVTVNAASAALDKIAFAMGSGLDFTVAGSGTLMLTSCTFSGGTGNAVITGTATLQALTSTAFPVGELSISNGATADMNGQHLAVDAFIGAGSIINSGGNAAFTNGFLNGSGTFSGVISGSAVELAKVGTGTQTLSGANSFSNTLKIYGGTVLITGGSGSATGAVTVENSSSSFGGTGTYGGAVAYDTGALAVFTEGSPMTFSSTLALNSTVVDVNAPANLAAGTYTLATYTSAGSSGSFATAPVFLSGGVASGLTASITTSGGTVSLVVAGAEPNTYVVTLPGQTFTSGSGTSGSVTAQTAGSSFTVTLTAVDSGNNTYATYTGSHTVTLTGPASGTFSPSTAQSVTFTSGQGTISVTLDKAAATTITASASDISSAGTSSSVTVNAGVFSQLQTLMPGQTAAAGTSTGKTGTPTAQTAGGSAASVTVNAVDANWNLISTNDTVAISSSDTFAILPASAALSGGTGTYSVTFKTAGSQTVTATDSTHGGITANTGSATTVNAGAETKLQLLMPGESAAAGSATGKTGSPTAQTAGTAVTVTVNAVDANWNVVSTNDTVGITSSDSHATLPASAALSSGTKTFSVTFKTAGSQTATATDSTHSGITANTGAAATINPAAFSKLQVLMPGETAAPGSATGKTGALTAQTAGTPVTVTVNGVDANWNLVSTNDTVAITSSDSAASLPANAPLSGGTGTYSVTFETVGSQTVTASDATQGGITANTGSATAVGAGAVNAGNTVISANPTSITANGFSTSTITVQARDVYNNNLTSSGGTVVLNATAGSLGGVTDNANGTYTATLTSPTSTATAASVTGTIAGNTIGNNATVTFTPGAVSAAHTVISASPTSITANGTSTSMITVQAEDANNNNETASSGTVVLSASSGSLSAVTDNSNGSYTATLTSSTTAGTANITGTIGGVTIGVPASVTYTAGTPTQLIIVTNIVSPQVDGLAFAPNPAIAVADQYGNVVTTATDEIDAYLAQPSAYGTFLLSSYTTNDAVAGVSVFTNLTFTLTSSSTPATDVQVYYSTPSGYTPVTNSVITVGPNVGLAFQTEPSSTATAGATLSPAPQVLVTNISSGLPVTGVNVSLTLIGGSGVLSGTTPVMTDGSGVATFSDLSINLVGGSYQLVAAIGPTTVTSTSFAVTPGAVSAANTTINASPATLTADGSSTSTITVQAVDADGNNLTSSGGTVVLSATAGSLGSVADNGNGTYTATLTAPTSTSTAATISGTIAGNTIGHNATVTFTPGVVSAAHTVISANPTSITANGTSTSTITVQAKDVNNNNETVSGGTVLLSTSLGSLGAVTDNGNGTYTAILTSSTTAGTANITGTIGGTTIGVPASVAFTPGAVSAAHTVISASPASLTANGASTSTITVQAKDANNNNETTSGGTVLLSTTTGSLGGVTDNGNGTYTATLTSATTVGTANITGTIGGTTIGVPASVAFTPGAVSAAHTVISASPTSLTANGTSTSTITVQAKDANNNNETTSGGTVLLSASAGFLTAVTDNGNGTYTATLTSATTTGTANITGTIGGTTIGVPASVAFTPGAVSAAHTVISASPTSITANGSSTSTITVQAEDVNNNDLTSSGGTVTLSTSAGSLGSVTDNGNGTYAATLTSGTTITTASITGKIGGTTIGNPTSVVYTPGPIASYTLTLTNTSALFAGTNFNVVVLAKDANGNAATNNSSTVVTMTSSTGNAQFDSNGDGTYGDNTKTLVNGTFAIATKDNKAEALTITATDSTPNTGTSSSVTVKVGAEAQLQVLLPGETAAPGTTTGKTGSPTAQSRTVAFNITVNSTDLEWNLVSSSDTVAITSTDGAATLPTTGSATKLSSGTKSISVTLNTVGNFTVSASDVTTPAITANTSSSVAVDPLPYFRSTNSGDWSDITIWQESTDGGVTWGAASVAPSFNNSGSILVTNNNTVTVNSAVTADYLVIAAGATVTVSGATFTINKGTGGLDCDVFGSLTVSSTASSVLTVSSGAAVAFENSGSFSNSQATPNAPTATWDIGSLCILNGSSASVPSGVSGATFGSFSWDYPTATASVSLTSGGSLTVNSNFTFNSGNAIKLANNGAFTLTVGGNIAVQTGDFNLCGGSTASTTTLNVAGNYSTSSAGSNIVSATAPFGLAVINFDGTVPQTWNNLGPWYDPDAYNFIVASGSDLQLLSGLTITSGVRSSNSAGVFQVNGTLDLDGNALGAAGLTGTGVITNSTGSSTVTISGTNITSFNGYFTNSTGTIGLTKAGTGTLTLNGTNAYAGTTSVSAGSLILGANASISNSPNIFADGTFDVSAVSGGFVLQNAQLLGGSGVVTGNVMVASGGLISPGSAAGVAGTLIVTNALTLNAASTNYFDLKTNGVVGGVNDLLVVGGTLTPNGSVIAVNVLGGVPLPAGSYRLVNYSSAKSTSFNATPVVVGGSVVGAMAIDETVSGQVNLTVAFVSTSTALTTSTNLSQVTSNVTFTATVSSSGGTPTGTVQFETNDVAYGAPVTMVSGVANFTTNGLPGGATLSITAVYSGDTAFSGSTSDAISQSINRPPVAGAYTLDRTTNSPVKVAISALLAVDTDPDGDTVSFLSASTATPGVTILYTTDEVYYLPASPDVNPTDTFTYTITDGRGGVATGTITVNIIPATNSQSQNILSIITLPDGNMQINFAGIPGTNYSVQATSSLMPPITWTTLGTVTADSDGLFQYSDLTATNFVSRYYRSATP